MWLKAKQLITVPKYILSEESNRSQKIRRLTYAVIWQLWKRLIRLPVVVPLDNGLRFIADPRAINSTGAIYTRIYEYRCITFARKHVKRGGILCDVGAHAGLYSLLIAPLFDKGICFEPADDTFELLRRNMGLNRLAGFELHKKAVSKAEGQLEFRSDGPYSGTAHIIKDVPQTSTGNTTKVPSVTLDSVFFERQAEKLNYLKIDAEGHEYPVLQGAVRTIMANPQMLIHVEITKNMNEIAGLLKRLGFRLFYLDNTGLPCPVKTPADHHIRVPAHYTSADRGDFIACGPGHSLYKTETGQ